MIKTKRGEGLVLAVVVFLVLWLVCSLVWVIWLDGISVPIAGAITSFIVVGGITYLLSSN